MFGLKTKSPQQIFISASKIVADVLMWLAITVGLHLLAFSSSLNLAWAFVPIFLLEFINRGSRVADDVLVGFAAIFGLVPIFGWIDLPTYLNPVSIVISSWLFVALRFPDRKIVSGMFALAAPTSSFLFTYFWWREFTQGGVSSVFSRLFPIWDMSAHFYFFIANLEHNRYLPLALPPRDLGQNKWAGIEYPTGIHYVWTRFLTSEVDQFVTRPADALPFFANSIILSYAACIAVISIAISRVCVTSKYRWYVTFFSFGISTFTLGLGVLSQTITSGFVNIAVVLSAGAIIASLLISPVKSFVMQNTALGLTSLVIAYNWYPVLLLVIPSLLIYLVRHCRSMRISSVVTCVFFWFAISAAGVAPIIQTLSLGISHLTIDGGVRAIPSNISIMVLLASALFCLLLFQKLSTVNRSLLMTPIFAHVSFYLYFRITEGNFQYYFQKINIFIVLFALCVCCVSSVMVVTTESTRTRVSNSWRLHTKTSFVVVLLTLMLTYLFGYVGPDSKEFAGEDSLLGIARRTRTLSVDPLSRRSTEIISSAADQIVDLPIEEKAWATLILPKRITKAPVGDGSVITLSNVWLHSLSKSQTLTAFQTSYVAANFEIRKSLVSDERIARELPNVFQPDSVTVFSTSQVISSLKKQPYQWKTIEFNED